MTGPVVAGLSLVLAALVVAWPVRAARRRRRQLLAGEPARRWWRASLASPLRWFARRALGAPASPPASGGRSRPVARSGGTAFPPAASWLVIAGAVVAGVRWGGPVAGAAFAAYGTLAQRALARRSRRRERDRARTGLLDALDAAAADLRAGLPASTALAGLAPATPERDPLRDTVTGAVALAERTGAPLAAVLERIETDARRADRASAAVAAQAAGSQATALLLSVLPAAGLVLGYAIGADPLPVLLRTPVGAACGLSALGLQLAGLAWCRRLIRPEVRA